MSIKNRRILLIVILAVTCVIVSVISIGLLYNAAYDSTNEMLTDRVHTRSALIEAVAKYDQMYNQGYPGGAYLATLKQIEQSYHDHEAHHFKQIDKNIDKSESVLPIDPMHKVEMVFGRMAGDSIEILLSHRNMSLGQSMFLTKDSNVAEPMRLALEGNSGSIKALDYRGRPVLAAYSFVEVLNIGMVAKIDLTDFRAPYVEAGVIAAAASLLLIILGSFLFGRVTEPIVKKLEEQVNQLERSRTTLQESEERYRTFFDNTSVGFFRTDAESKIMTANPACLRILGYNSLEDINKRDLPNRGYVDADAVEEFVRKMETDGRVNGYEAAWWHKNGSKVWVRESSHAVRDNDGKLLYYEGTFEDLSDRKRIEDERNELDIQRQIALDAAELGWWRYDPISKMAYWDDRYKEIFAVTGYERLNEEILKRLHPDDLPNVWAEVEAALNPSDPKPYTTEYRIYHPDGSLHWIEAHGMALFEDKGNERRAVALVGTVQDITKRKQANDALSKSQHDLAILNKELNFKNRELEQIVYVTSHDLRSPLLNIQGFSKELKALLKDLNEITDTTDIADDKKQKITEITKVEIPEAVKYIETSSVKMDSLLSGLLKLSRLGRVVLEPKQLDMNALLADVTAAMEFRLKEINTELNIEDLPECWGDEIQINQVFTNLIDNAIKYRDPDRSLKINVEGGIENDYITYTVEDSGVGIEEAHKEIIFDIFHRLDPSKSNGEGLGLTIVRRILQRHNGRITAESEPGKGSRFIIKLPKIEQDF